MLGLETQYKLRDFLQQISERELEIERQRQILGEIQDFEPYAAFCRLNRSEDKRVTADEVYRFLQENSVTHLTERECGRIISYFDSDNDNGLNYKEWMEILLPCDDLYMRSVITQRPSSDCPRGLALGFTVEKQVALLLKLEIELHIQLERLTHDLKRRFDWSHIRAFQTIDNRGEGFLNYNNIMNFCRMNSWRASESQIIAIVRRLDIDADQRVTFTEFAEMMDEQQDISPAIKGDPASDNRDDPYFRHTSPAKAYQQRSPQREMISPSRCHTSNQLAFASSQARNTRQDYQSGRRESPLRSSPQRVEAARASYSASKQKLVPLAYPVAKMDQHSNALRGACGSPTRRPDSPLRQRSPRFVNTEHTISAARMSAQKPSQPSPELLIAVAEHDKICGQCTRPCGCNVYSRSGQPRARITQNLMSNSAAKQYRQFDCVDETPYESIARNNQSLQFSAKQDGQTAPRRSNLQFDEEEELVGAFREYIRLELELNEAKSRLACQDDFNMMDAYQMIDKLSKGWVTAPEILESLLELGSNPHKDDVYLFVRRYDKDGDGRILYSDFCDAFTPVDEVIANTMQRRPALHIQNGFCRTHFFSMETRNMFLSTFRSHFTIEESAELLRKRLGRRPDFNIHEAFLTVDRDSNGYVSRSELRRFLTDNGIFASERELQMLIYRFDRNNDGRVSYAEFMEEMVPKCPLK